MTQSNKPFVTQRAYTLRLQRAPGPCPSCGGTDCACWREALWATHEAVNKGAKAFGDWLLTLRGGLCHKLAESSSTNEESRDRRVLLALSWLTVEDERGAPKEFVVAQAADPDRPQKVHDALREILRSRGLGKQEIEDWLKDCAASLGATIRDDAVWVNRSKAFDAAVERIGSSLTRDEVWDLLEPFFGSRERYFAGIRGEKRAVDEQATGEFAESREKAKDLVQKAGQWLSSRFGTGKGASFSQMKESYSRISLWASNATSGVDGKSAISNLAEYLSLPAESRHIKGVLQQISGTGHKSATRNYLRKLARTPRVSAEDLKQLATLAQKDSAACGQKTARKGRRRWADAILADVERQCGLTYLRAGESALHWQFSVMLDHAARRVSIAHSWIKRAEARRREFEEGAKKLRDLQKRAPNAVRWLDTFCQERSVTTGAGVPGGYRIRRRAIEGWYRVVQAWADPSCKTTEDRIAAAREVQADPELEKFGDIQLFEALAADEAMCVWKPDTGEPDASILTDYVAGKTAEYDQRRFKVPAYRHPDPLRHPVFCDFGESRWAIEFACHRALQWAKRAKRLREQDAEWLDDRRGLRMGLWDGKTVNKVNLRWSSKRLSADLALGDEAGPTASEVTRADRLGRAASGADGPARVSNVFDEKEWNGRLQAPRDQLERIARLLERGKADRAKAARERLRWIISLSPRLRPSGPFIDYARRMGIESGREGRYYPNSSANRGRGRLAKLILSRLPGIRLLSVDLGHRFAAACAVWEALSPEQFKKEIEGLKVSAGGCGQFDLHLHAKREGNDGKSRVIVYRRIGADTLPDGRPHPAPWARLDRQFLIKLQGEERPARKAAPAELKMIEGWERFLGRVRGQDDPMPRRVDLLMSQTVKTLRRGLLRHAQRALIAFNLVALEKLLPGGARAKLDRAGRIEVLTDTLVMWLGLFSGNRWEDRWAEQEWKRRGLPDLRLTRDEDEYAAGPGARGRLKALEEKLRRHAGELAGQDLSDWSAAWAARWREDDARWPAMLRMLKRWIAPRGLRALRTDDEATRERKRAARASARYVGGLSLTRINTISGLYQLLKAYKMRAEPDDPRKNVPKKDDNQLEDFHRRLLKVRNNLREQRVKQLASRIVEAALGLGRVKSFPERRSPERPRIPVDRPCHAVVTESLTNYRPDDMRTRRENRQLMSWSAGKVKKLLSESCELYGLYLREVAASYTSRQCSRTGLPGVRCDDVPVKEFLHAPWWRTEVNKARKRIEGNRGEARDRFLVDLADRIQKLVTASKPVPATVRVPRQGGALFVAAPPADPAAACVGASDVTHINRAIAADLNAAANIGLRALFDPDWPGRWWYVPCRVGTNGPAWDLVKGSAAFGTHAQNLPTEPGSAQLRVDSGASGPKKKRRKGGNEIEYRWRDPSACELRDGSWQPTRAYWRGVEERVISLLRKRAGLDA